MRISLALCLAKRSWRLATIQPLDCFGSRHPSAGCPSARCITANAINSSFAAVGKTTALPRRPAASHVVDTDDGTFAGSASSAPLPTKATAVPLSQASSL